MTRTLLLFDIDGTLLLTGGAGLRAMVHVASKVFAKPFDLDGMNTSGMLDPVIFEQLAARHGITDPWPKHETYRALFVEELRAELGRSVNQVRLLPGIASLITALHHRAQQRGDVQLGLLSGNYRAAVPIKFAYVGLDPAWFEITALGDDASRRSDLTRIAMQQYERQWHERPDPRRVVLIGDTPRDVEAAKAHDCVAFAVATGRYSSEELNDAGADVVVENLVDPTPLFTLIDQ